MNLDKLNELKAAQAAGDDAATAEPAETPKPAKAKKTAKKGAAKKEP
jgi:hypothetical protein